MQVAGLNVVKVFTSFGKPTVAVMAGLSSSSLNSSFDLLTISRHI